VNGGNTNRHPAYVEKDLADAKFVSKDEWNMEKKDTWKAINKLTVSQALTDQQVKDLVDHRKIEEKARQNALAQQRNEIKADNTKITVAAVTIITIVAEILRHVYLT
jgi:hypothetical protein